MSISPQKSDDLRKTVDYLLKELNFQKLTVSYAF